MTRKGTSKLEQNKAVVRQFFDAYEKRDSEAISKLVSPKALYHSAKGVRNDHAFTKRAKRFLSAFTDIRIEIEDQIAESDMVMSRCRFHVTHRGEFLGISATGKRISSTLVQIDRIQDGRIVEQWFQYDLATMLEQMGVMKSLGRGPKRSKSASQT